VIKSRFSENHKNITPNCEPVRQGEGTLYPVLEQVFLILLVPTPDIATVRWF
jgi:hypothetical protein